MQVPPLRVLPSSPGSGNFRLENLDLGTASTIVHGFNQFPGFVEGFAGGVGVVVREMPAGLLELEVGLE